MQKLDWRDTYTPLDSKSRGNCDSFQNGIFQNGILKSLNSLERDSVPNLKTHSNSSDESLPVSKIWGGFIFATVKSLHTEKVIRKYD